MFEQEFLQGTLTPILAIVGAVFGLIGTLVGVFNLWCTFNANRVRVRVDFSATNVRQSNMSSKSYRSANGTINIVNLSTFPITVTEVGYCYRIGMFGSRYVPTYQRFTRIEDRSKHGYVNVFAPERTRKHGWANPLVASEKMDTILCAYTKLSDGSIRRSRGVWRRTRSIATETMVDEQANA